MAEPLYSFELWDMSGHRVADISPFMKSRRYSRERNAAESLSFSLDLNNFERYCANYLNAEPKLILSSGQTDIKVKRGGEYLFGVWVDGTPTTAGADSQSISVQATGYLNLVRKRNVTKSYTSTESTSIASDLITTTQSTAGTLGLSLAGSPYITGVNRDRTYTRQNVKDAIINLTNLVNGSFDFEFTWDKKFRTVQELGARRGDIQLIYGGDSSNVKMLYANSDVTQLFNSIVGLGSGFGDDQLKTDPAIDVPSTLNYYAQQKIEQFNSIVDQFELDENTRASLARYKDPVRIPQVTITGLEMASGLINPGDRIPLRIVGHPFLEDYTGLYRVEKIDVQIDENGFESDVMLYFDDLGVDQSEEAA